MKKAVVMCTVTLFIVSMGICYAGGLGPVEPLGPETCEVGIEYNGIMDKDLEGSGSIKTKGTEVDWCNQVYLKAALGVGSFLNIYGKLGAANLKQQIKWNDDYLGRTQTLEYDEGVFWGVGTSGLYDFGNQIGLGGDFQFNMWYNDINTVDGSEVTYFQTGGSGSLENCEIQTSLYMTYTFQPAEDFRFVPYLGGYYSYFESSIDDPIKYADAVFAYELKDLENDDKFGLLVGANISALENVAVNLECRFLAETAFTGGLSCRF